MSVTSTAEHSGHGRLIAQSTLWQIGSQAIMALLSILTVKFVAMGLSKELAGNYHSAYGYLQLFGILADFGLYAVAVREVSSSKQREEVLGALLILRSVILMLSLSAALLIVWAMPAWRGTPLPLGVTIAVLVPFFTLLSGILRTVFQIHYAMHFVFVAEVTQKLMGAVLIGLFIALGIRGSSDLQHYHLFLFIGGISAFALFLQSFVYASRFMKIRPHWNGPLLRSLLGKAAPYGFAFLCMALYRQLDVTLIALLRPDYELQNAYYGFALRVVEMAYLVPTFLLNSTLPILSARAQSGEDTRHLLGKTLFALLLVGSVAALYTLLWARPLMLLLTTESYLSTPLRPGSDTALGLLALPVFLNGLILFGFYSMLTRHAWKALVTTLSITAFCSIMINMTLIPRYGFVGAAETAIFTHILLACLLVPQSLRAMPARLSLRMIVQWLSFTALFGLGLFAAVPLLSSAILTLTGLGLSFLVLLLLILVMGIRRTLAF